MSPNTADPTAAATVSLTGRYRRQGTEAAAALQLWAEQAGVNLVVVDDAGSAALASGAYADWIGKTDLLIGPYASGLVRAICPLFRDSAQLLWNHGGAADDLAQPMIASLPAPASSYLREAVDITAARGIDQVVIVQGAGPFAHAVADGAADRARERRLSVQHTDAGSIEEHQTAGTAWLLAGHFDHDVDLVRRLRLRRPTPPLIAAVAAGIRAFGRELGGAADGIYGPAQWWPTDTVPDIGPAGTDFAKTYQTRTGQQPSYVAAQAAAAGYLANTAHQLQLSAEDVTRWQTSTLLGSFQLDTNWRQVGHHITTVRWQDGQLAYAEHTRP